jgi:hypothetical protein
MADSNYLDEQGFTFTDLRGKEYLVRIWHDGNAWLFYRHPDGEWVSLRKVSQQEVWAFNMQAEAQHG